MTDDAERLVSLAEACASHWGMTVEEARAALQRVAAAPELTRPWSPLVEVYPETVARMARLARRPGL